jgi:hypothetical protein
MILPTGKLQHQKVFAAKPPAIKLIAISEYPWLLSSDPYHWRGREEDGQNGVDAEMNTGKGLTS